MDYEKKIKNALNDKSIPFEVQAWLEEQFPELKESEDEKIRKSLYAYFAKFKPNDMWDEDFSFGDILAWLERQGEQKPVDKVEPKFKVGDKIISTISNIPYYITEVCNGHYLTDVGCIIMFNAQNNFELVEQKPAAWSEEDELHIKELESLVKRVWAIAEHENDKDTIHEMSDLSFFLKTLKPQLKREWSEDDKRCLTNAIHACKQMSDEDYDYSQGYIDAINWLKSLKPQNTWKPSDEQIKAVEDSIEFLGCTKKVREDLKSLYEQLKKLREE